MKQIALVLFLAVVATLGCSKPNEPTGLADWPAVMRVTEGMLNSGDTATLIRHTDTTGVPSEKLKKVKDAFRSWQGVPNTLKLDNVDIVDFKDFKYNEDMSEKMAKFLGAPKWGRLPEKIIVYRYSGTENTSVKWYFGVFQDHEKWFFSTSYE